MPERDPHKRGDKDFQDVCFALAKTFFYISEHVNPLTDFSDRRGGFKRSALKARRKGLINQNPGPESLKTTSQSV
jgi:hypothetical protein